MNEKILIQSEKYNVKKLSKILIIIGLLFSIIAGIRLLIEDISYRSEYKNDYRELYDEYYEDYLKHIEMGHSDDCGYEYHKRAVNVISSYRNKEDYVNYHIKGNHKFAFSDIIFWVIWPVLSSYLIAVILYLWLNSYKLTVTDKRVNGVTTFGKRVDLPMDSISSVSITKLLRGCGISTSSGNIHFLAIKNCQAIYETLNQLLIERQDKKSMMQNRPLDGTEEIMKYKKLLDEGIITKEEFEDKKKEILK